MADVDGMEDDFFTRLFSLDGESDDKRSGVVLDRSDHCSSDTEVTPRTESVLSQPAEPLLQSVHTCYLTQGCSDKLDIHTETLIPVKSNRGSKEYCEWWKHQQHDPKLFGAQLIGDNATPQKFAGMSFSDLSFFCEWGRNRVTDFQAIAGPLQLTLPVLTSPDIVQLAVAGIYSGTIALSWSTVEPVLVLANSIGLVCLEEACQNYFAYKALQLTDCRRAVWKAVAQLGSHVGLVPIAELAAECIVKRPWEDGMQVLKEVLELPTYLQNKARMNQLLHHAQRGAYTELQILEILDSMNMPEAFIADMLKIDKMQTEELHALLSILLSSQRQHGPLLRQALEQHMLPECLRPSRDPTCHTRFLHNVMLTGKDQAFPLPESPFSVYILEIVKNGMYLCDVLHNLPQH
ncbi:TPA: hypothetical protein ACH3X2_001171 [Trebouxia sp. C0005]